MKMVSSMVFLVSVAIIASLENIFANGDCSGYKVYCSGLNSSEIQTIVNRHNELRLQVATGKLQGQPKASNLKRMKWDKTLANEAQKIAETCEFAHKPVDDDRFYVGQNLWKVMGSASVYPKMTAFVDSWWSENKDYKYPNNPSSKTGHYTQEVWADTYLVGCGMVCYKDPKWYNAFVVCNYGPGGNIVGRPPYKTGGGCENLC